MFARVRRLAGFFTVGVVMCMNIPAMPAGASTSITISGVVHCHDAGVEGVWVASSGGGSGYANFYAQGTGKSDGSSDNVQYSRTFSAATPTGISLHVGCGGSPASWATTNYSTVGRVANGSRVLNAFCGNGQPTGPCRWPDKGTTTNHNLGEHLQCTEGALADFHAYANLWPYWTGNAADWSHTAKANGWEVTTVPMPKSIVVFPGTGTNPDGHVAWVDHLITRNHIVTGLYVHEENYDGSASHPTGHTRWHGYRLNSAYHYIPAS